jgi:hypothetical protein
MHLKPFGIHDHNEDEQKELLAELSKSQKHTPGGDPISITDQ